MMKGSIKYAYYKNGGHYKATGLRNKRSAHWARVRQMEAIRQERIEEKRMEQENRYRDEFGLDE